MTRTIPLLAALAATALSVAPVQAQGTSSTRSGFHFSTGGGIGAAGITCEGCDFNLDDTLNGFSGFVRLGGAVSNNVVLAAEGTGWIKNEAPLERRIAAASVVVLIYPSGSGFFLKAGVGYLRAVVEDDSGWIASDGIAPQAGIGIDLTLGDGLSLTPFVNGILSTNSSTDASGYNLPIALDPYVLQAGVAITVR